MALLEIDSYLKKIDKLTDNGNLEQAAFHCLYLLRQFPKMLRIYERLGRIFLEMDNYNSALNVYLRLCSSQPDNFLHHISLAYTYVECGLWENAVIHCETATALEPDNQAIANDLSSWMTTHSVLINTEDKLLEEFKSGIKAYHEKDYNSAIRHFLSSEQKPIPNLSILFLGLSYAAIGDVKKAIWLMESIIRREPYNQTALKTLCVYYYEHDQMRFKQCLDKLIDLDPIYQHWEVKDNNFLGQHFPINIAYYDWTGIPNTRVRIGWHQASEKLIINDNSKIPAWLDLIPISEKENDIDNNVTKLLNDFENHNMSEGFYRKSFFTSKNNIPQPTDIDLSERNKKKIQESNSELDQAFSYLEQIAVTGFQSSKSTNETVPVPAAPVESVPTAAQPGTNDETVTENLQPSQEDRQLLREAWRCFSTDQQDIGVQLYKKLVERENCKSAVKEELEKLVILFPDNKELSSLFESIQ